MRDVWLKCACLMGMLLSAGFAQATNIITGNITASTNWSGTNLLRGTVVIQSNVTVTIEAGTRMLMNTGAVLSVRGQLLADGTSNAPILFRRASAAMNAPWGRIIFDRAAPSRLRHCVIEHANAIGDHQDYYPSTSCNPPVFAPRNYHEAVVCLAGHLDIEGCTFQNLPDEVVPPNRSTERGDAIAIISDHPDPLNTNSWNSASATVQNCVFRGIGQGVHSRYAYVLVQNCLFTNKWGDNDHVDLYGESDPPPLIQNNLFYPVHEDAINPTRCSAIILNNVIGGSDDHGIVLRDRGKPIVMNNLVYNCNNACIAVQNQCDALIVNNTLRNSARGIRFFDHFDRAGPPYCLFRGSGRATIINCVIWDCTSSLELTDSTNGHSYASIAYCDVEGGQATASVSANSTLIWALGNTNADPLFVNLAANNFRLRSGSPCIDTGTNMSARLNRDYDGIPRPLDGNGDGTAAFDIGAHEFLLASADSNGDGIPDGWTWQYGLNPTDPNVGSSNPDNDPHTTLQEWTADTDPINPLSYFRIASLSLNPATVHFLSSSNRQYSLSAATNLAGSWMPVPGQQNVPGTGGMRTLSDPEAASNKFYRISVRLP